MCKLINTFVVTFLKSILLACYKLHLKSLASFFSLTFSLLVSSADKLCKRQNAGPDLDLIKLFDPDDFPERFFLKMLI